MTNTDDVVDVAECELEKLVGQDRTGVCKPEKRVISKHCPEAHRSSMQDGFMAKAAQAAVTMDNLNLFPDDHIAEYWEERKHGWHGGFPVDDQERHMVDLQSVGQIVYTSSTIVRVSYDDNLVPAVDQLGGELVYVAFHSARLGEEEIADHGDIVRHFVGVFRHSIRFMSSVFSIAVRVRELKYQMRRVYLFSQGDVVSLNNHLHKPKGVGL